MPGANETETSEINSNVSAENADAFRWNVRPSDREPSKRWGVLVGAVLAFALGMLLLNNVMVGLLGFAIILAATAEFWLGVSYKLDATGATARCGLSPTVLEWTSVKRAEANAEGIKLSPLETPSRMDAFRGVFLRYGSDRERVIESVRRWLPNDVRLLER